MCKPEKEGKGDSEASLTVVMKYESKFISFFVPKIQIEKGERPLYHTNKYYFFVVDSLGKDISKLEGIFYLPYKKLCFPNYSKDCDLRNCCQDVPNDWPDIDSLFACCDKEIATAQPIRLIPSEISIPKIVHFGDIIIGDDPDYTKAYMYILDTKDEIFLDSLEKRGIEVCRKDCLNKKCAGLSCPKPLYDYSEPRLECVMDCSDTSKYRK